MDRDRLSVFRPGQCFERTTAETFSRDSECGVVCDVEFLAGCGRAGRAVVMRDHRQAAVRSADGSAGGGATALYRRQWRLEFLSVQRAAGDHRLEAGAGSIDPQHDGSWGVSGARSAFAYERLWADVFAESACVSGYFTHRGFGEYLIE